MFSFRRGDFAFVFAAVQRPVTPFQHERRCPDSDFPRRNMLLGFRLDTLRRVQPSWDTCELALGVRDARDDLVVLLEQLTQPAAVEKARAVDFRVVEFSLAGVGGLIDPVGGDRLGEDIERGVVAVRGDERPIRVCAADRPDIEVADITPPFIERQAVLHGPTLATHPVQA